MNIQSKINAVRGRITQIENSNMFSDTEKTTLLKANHFELEVLQTAIKLETSLTK